MVGRFTIFGNIYSHMSKMGIIYLATNKTNGKRYVGKTVSSLSRRRSHHGCKGYAFYNAIKKYGRNGFDWVILCKCPISRLDEREKYFIKLYNTCISHGGYGYNIQEGGNGAPYGNSNPSKRPDVREKQRMAALGDKNPMKNPLVSDKVRQALKGRPISKTHRKNISKGMMGHFVPKGKDNWISKRFSITFPDGHTEIITGLLGFCRENNLSYERLRYAQKKHGTSTDGFKVELYDESNSKSSSS